MLEHLHSFAYRLAFALDFGIRNSTGIGMGWDKHRHCNLRLFCDRSPVYHCSYCRRKDVYHVAFAVLVNNCFGSLQSNERMNVSKCSNAKCSNADAKCSIPNGQCQMLKHQMRKCQMHKCILLICSHCNYCRRKDVYHVAFAVLDAKSSNAKCSNAKCSNAQYQMVNAKCSNAQTSNTQVQNAQVHTAHMQMPNAQMPNAKCSNAHTHTHTHTGGLGRPMPCQREYSGFWLHHCLPSHHYHNVRPAFEFHKQQLDRMPNAHGCRLSRCLYPIRRGIAGA